MFTKSKEKQLLLIYGYLRLNLNNYFINNIVNILKEYVIQKFYWDSNTIFNGSLTFYDNNLVVKHNGKQSTNYMVFCNVVFDSGTHIFEVKIDDRCFPTGMGLDKKSAEQTAAKIALETLNAPF